MLLLGTRNATTQVLTTGDSINFGSVYRKYCKKNNCGVKTFDLNSTSIALQQEGVYHLTATITFTTPTAGDVTFQLTQNGFELPSAFATETITTATTEVKTTTIDYFVLVDSNCILGIPTTLSNIAITLTGVDATISNVVVNIEKVI